MASSQHSGSAVLVTGASGYVGGKLARALAEGGRRVRCLIRNPARAGNLPAGAETSVGDVRDPDALARALEGVESAYYLVHSMGAPGSFEAEDRRSAQVFGRQARIAGVRRIVYLGGLGEAGSSLSAHLRSRHETGEILKESGVPVLEFRSSVVIGCGSTSFEMIRALVERLPVMVTPRWVSVETQPIASRDLIEYLRRAIDVPLNGSLTLEIGGPDRVSYGDLMREYARQRSLRRWMVPVPMLTPRLSSLWLAFVTPYFADVGRHLVDSLRNPTVVRDPTALRMFDIRPQGVSEAIHQELSDEDRALSGTDRDELQRRSDAIRGRCGLRIGSRIFDTRTIDTPVPTERAFGPIERIGGATGWYYGNWLWRIRGLADLAFGGVGMRSGRRPPGALRAGDELDFWRVEACDPPRRLRLRAEMKVPGEAWLEFDVSSLPGGSRIRQTAVFKPRGLWGLAYWYALYPAHDLIFSGMLRGIARAASRTPLPAA